MTKLEQEIAHLQELQAKHRKNIRTLEELLANYGLERPLPLLNNLEFEREQFRKVEERLAQALAASVGGVVVGGVNGDDVVPSLAPDKPKLPYHNLPQPDYGIFIGRKEELAKIHGLLLPYPRSRYHVIIIDGIGGIGKSALALESAYRYLREYDNLPNDERFDAIIWASAKQSILTAEGVISRRAELHSLNDIYAIIAATLEREDITRVRIEERPTVVARALARQRTLLIMDNLEAVDDEQVIAFIREVPDPTKVIVTMRQRIDVAYPVRLVAMPCEDAKRFIAQECAKKDVILTDAQAHKLYERTGGVPLALVWSIARVALGEEIKYVLRRLACPESDIARFCFKGVVQDLRDGESYKLLVASALFAQDASREALGHVAGIEDELSCETGLITLAGLSLLNKHADRFSLLPLTRSFLEWELERMPQFAQAAFERMLAYYKQLVTPPKEVSVGVPYWDGLLNHSEAQSLEQEWSNLVHVVRWALDENRHGAALDLFLPIVHFLGGWGLWDERLQLSREVCRMASTLGDSSEAWLWIDAIGWVLLQRKRFSECITALHTGRLLARQFDLADALILADAWEAALHSAMGDITLAKKRIESALKQVDLDSALERGSQVRRLVAGRVVGVAAELSQLGQDFIHARELRECALELRQSTGEGTSSPLMHLGYVSLKLDDITSAEEYFVQVLASAQRNEIAMARSNYGLALVAEQKDELQEARHLCELALEQFTRLGLESGVQDTQQLLARLQR